MIVPPKAHRWEAGRDAEIDTSIPVCRRDRSHRSQGTSSAGPEALASFRETHLEFARRYIHAHVRDPRGTGGTPYLEWLSQLIDETRAHMI